MYWIIGYAVVGIVLSELTIRHQRKRGWAGLGPFGYLAVAALWPAIVAAALVKVCKG